MHLNCPKERREVASHCEVVRPSIDYNCLLRRVKVCFDYGRCVALVKESSFNDAFTPQRQIFSLF